MRGVLSKSIFATKTRVAPHMDYTNVSTGTRATCHLEEPQATNSNAPLAQANTLVIQPFQDLLLCLVVNSTTSRGTSTITTVRWLPRTRKTRLSVLAPVRQHRSSSTGRDVFSQARSIRRNQTTIMSFFIKRKANQKR